MTSSPFVQEAPSAAVSAWDNPPAVAPRGTVILVAGRGEHPGVYERFGTRVASDGYKVRVVGDPTADEAGVRARVRELLDDPDLPGPRVLAGSDAGAAFVAALAAAGTGAQNPVDGLVLAGLPTGEHAASAGSWDSELAERTACPTHQSRLSNDPQVRRGSLLTPVPADWFAAADLGRVQVPVLAVHGAADLVSPVRAARESVAKAPSAEFVTIAGGRHDALNDATHRTAAAVVVLFLERLRDLALAAGEQGVPAALAGVTDRKLPAIAAWATA
ncbi:lysophospholipase [Parafrankia colletiae]|uniref:Lysophospholipase n=1 Tax=Parafrankia colletiae TaxID=573497 RepID=A0A1S1RHY3_9ACTN|nr:alpha/beta hydrolase [Parafrankia colletiae]MCK9899755.1 alpha/beta hydrolase [Frankia sp. Cpl3]OHV46363.1 lysophospholipase [Parafrankia colletiae]